MRRPFRTRLQLEHLESRELLSATYFPDTSGSIALFSDQLNSGLSNQLVQFISSHYDGTQKMLPSENARYVADNPNWTLLDYRLATASGPASYIINGQWGSDWSTVTQNESWFMHDSSGQRLYNSQWDWYLNDISNTQWQQYWIKSTIANMRADGAQGVFADSFTAGISDGWFTVSDPRFSGSNAANPSAWPNGVTWVQQQQNLINAVETAFAATPEQFKYIPNLDALVTGWYNLDTSKLDGAFLENFGEWGPSYLNGSPSDWTLSMNRALSMTSAGKDVIMQPNLEYSPGSTDGLLQRGFDLGTYLLIKGDHTYLNMTAPGGSASGAFYYPEYGINLGDAATALPTDVSNYLWDGVYRRDFQNGVVLVNPTNSSVTVNMGQAYNQAVFSGGGALTDASLDANGNYVGGTLSYNQVQTVTLAPGSSAILLDITQTPQAPSAPTGLSATAASSGQINLSWNAAAGASSYTVQRSADGSTNWTQIASGLSRTSYSDTGLQASTPYYYQVLAVNSTGTSAPSARATATTQALPAPTGVSATATSSGQVNLSWAAVTGATGYTVQRSLDGTTNWTQVASGLTGTDYSDTGLQASTAYFYRILATSSASTSAPSATASATTQAASSNGVLFSDNFNAPSINSAWSFVNGTWSQANGVLAQTSTGAGDPKKALVTNQTFPAAVTVTARVRVDSWAGGDYARAGVTLYNNPTTGAGYNLVFHNGTGSGGTVQFLDDGNAWGNSYSFNWSVGTWYWFQLQENNGVLYGKVWADGTAEPTSWMFTQSGWTDRTGGAPGLNGGSASGATVSFSNFSVSTTVAQVSVPATPTGLSATASSSSQINLSWNAVSGATSYAVQRSPDGSTGWTQVASGLSSTNYSDTGLQASTAYYYRVLAANSAGSSAPSATATATTPAASSTPALFSDNFSSSSINPAWKFVGGSWSQANGTLSQTSTGAGDPKKALLTDQTYPANVMITAKVRVDSWAGGDYARAGVSLSTDPTTGAGYNLVFHNGTGSSGTVQFLDDGNAWGNSYSFNWSLHTWYWFKLEDVNGVLYGKVWQDGTPEPTNWMFTQAGWTSRKGGAPGLNGGSAGASTASFEDVTVTAV